MHESTDSSDQAPRRALDFRRDAVALTSAMLTVAEFRKSDPAAIVEVTEVFYHKAWTILARLHGEQMTENSDTLEALADQDESEANQVEEQQTGHDLSSSV